MGFAGIAVGAAMVCNPLHESHPKRFLLTWPFKNIVWILEWLPLFIAFCFFKIFVFDLTGWVEAHLWIYDLQFLYASHWPGYKLSCQDLLHVGGPSACAHSLQGAQWRLSRCSCPALTVLRCLVWALPGLKGGQPLEFRGCKRTY